MAGIHQEPPGQWCVGQGDEGQAQALGAGLLSGSPRWLPPAMDGGSVPLSCCPRWLLLSSWLWGGSRSQGHHRVLAGMHFGGCGTPLREGIWGERAPAAAPGRAPAPALWAVGQGQPHVSSGWPQRAVVAVKLGVLVSHWGQGCQGFPRCLPQGISRAGHGHDPAQHRYPSNEFVQPQQELSQGALGNGACKVARPSHTGSPCKRGHVMSPHPYEGGCAVSPCCHPTVRGTQHVPA